MMQLKIEIFPDSDTGCWCEVLTYDVQIAKAS